MASDASAWLESVKGYLQPATRVALEMKEQIEGFDWPPVVMKTYARAAGAVGVDDVSPLYLGLSVFAAGGVLLLATCGCGGGGGAGRKKKKVPSKKKKSRSKSKPGAVVSNGSALKNGHGGDGDVKTAANGSAPRGLPAKQAGGKNAAIVVSGGVNGVPRARGVTAGGNASKPAKKPPQGSEKAKGKSAEEAPPVITEEPEPAKKRVRKKKTKASAPMVATEREGAAKASTEKKYVKNGSTANGFTSGGVKKSRTAQNKVPAVEADLWEEKRGEEWQTVLTNPLEAEWETVSHKKSRPRKEKAAVDGPDATPGGLEL